MFESFGKQQKHNFLNPNIMGYLAVLGIVRENIVFVRKPNTCEYIVILEPVISISDDNCYFADEGVQVWLYSKK